MKLQKNKATTRYCKIEITNHTENTYARIDKNPHEHGCFSSNTSAPDELLPGETCSFISTSRFGGMTTVGVSGVLEFVLKGTEKSPLSPSRSGGMMKMLTKPPTEESVPVQLKVFWVYPVFGNPFFGGRARDHNVGVWFSVSKVDDMTLSIQYYIYNKDATFGNITGISPPLLVFVNTVSAIGEGLQLLTKLKLLLPSPHQVVDVMQVDPVRTLDQFKNVKDLRVLICGGDGTAKMIADAMAEVTWPSEPPPFAICPLGTGNDLGRVLGWGGDVETFTTSIIDDVMNARVVNVDRWKVSMSSGSNSTTSLDDITFTNYLSLGYVDSKVALEFSQMRESNPGIFRGNKYMHTLMYGALGTKAIIEKTTNLADIISISIDGKSVDFKESFEGLVVLNICSYAGGTNLWGHSDPVSFCDEELEVVGIRSLVHLGKIKSGLEYAVKLGRGSNIKILFHGGTSLPIKIDGDLWRQEERLELNINFLLRTPMLARVGSSSEVIYGSAKHGYLRKSIVGPVPWTWRYCVVKSGHFFCFCNAHEKESLEVYPLAQIVASVANNDLILAMGSGSIIFQCRESSENPIEWLDACLSQGARCIAGFLM